MAIPPFFIFPYTISHFPPFRKKYIRPVLPAPWIPQKIHAARVGGVSRGQFFST